MNDAAVRQTTADGRLRQLINGVEAEGWRFVAFVRLVPLFPFNLVNYALGLTRVVVVCRTDKRSAKAAELLAGGGWRDIEILEGGMEPWNRLGFPVNNRQPYR